MSAEDCTHDCSTCGEDCAERSGIVKEELFPGASVKKVYAVVSGKGGVGKSLVTSLMASEMQRRGYQAAVPDADITGPSIPKSFGINQHATATEDYLFPNYSTSGIQVMSTNLIIENQTDPVVWRGPVIAGVVTQFWNQVMWQDVDFMFVDMPPGTGDVALTVFQSLPIDGIIVVTSPQELVGMIVEKAVNMANMMNVPILGIVENMSYFKCPDCDKEHKIFGESHIDEIAAKYNIKNIAKLPMQPEIAQAADTGCIEKVDTSALSDMVEVLENI